MLQEYVKWLRHIVILLKGKFNKQHTVLGAYHCQQSAACHAEVGELCTVTGVIPNKKVGPCDRFHCSRVCIDEEVLVVNVKWS